MIRSMLFGAVVFALCGCGVAVTKSESTEEKSVAPTPIVVEPEPREVYDKVAPMPREVKRGPAKPNDLNNAER